jgi:hypothetical protein
MVAVGSVVGVLVVALLALLSVGTADSGSVLVGVGAGGSAAPQAASTSSRLHRLRRRIG